MSFTTTASLPTPSSEAEREGPLAPASAGQRDTVLVLGGGNAPGAYHAGADQLAAKRFDFSPSSIRDRWDAGTRDMTRGTDWMKGDAPVGRRVVYANL